MEGPHQERALALDLREIAVVARLGLLHTLAKAFAVGHLVSHIALERLFVPEEDIREVGLVEIFPSILRQPFRRRFRPPAQRPDLARYHKHRAPR
jgi:hypothetical protein